MKKVLLFVLLLLVVLALLSSGKTQPAAPSGPFTSFSGNLNSTVFIFYYAWYSAPPRTPNYGHWDGGGGLNVSKGDIMSAFYPSLGPYDSANSDVIEKHMEEIKASGVDVVVVSWWGKGHDNDSYASTILQKANQNGLKVSFVIEPYSGRSTSSIISDIKYLNNKYGTNPAFYKVARPTEYGTSKNSRPVYFLYQLDASGDLAKSFDSLRNTKDDSILLARMDDSKLYLDRDVRAIMDYTHLDGLFNYSETNLTASFPKSSDYILVFAVQPGQDHTRIPPFKDTTVSSRENGAYYDRFWNKIVQQKPEAVSVISFNEWGESTQIEPAKQFKTNDYTYQDYEGAYGKHGVEAESAYLERTKYWIALYK